MGYCLNGVVTKGLGSWALGVGGKRARRWGQARAAHGASSRRAGHSRLGGLGVLLGQQAVHSVHSACFGPVSTQYYS